MERRWNKAAQTNFDEVRRHCVPARLQDGLEGIVSKRRGSPYRSGRSKDWIKKRESEGN
jgi:ATP-dependent DNA ligase